MNPLLGRQLSVTGKQSYLLHGFLFHRLHWGLREWDLPQISDSTPIATATRFAAKAKCKAISNKVLMVFKYRMQDTATIISLQLLSAGSQGRKLISVCAKNIHQQIFIYTPYTPKICFQEKNLNFSITLLCLLSSLPKYPPHQPCPLSTSKQEKGTEKYKESKGAEGRPHKNRGLR